VRIAFSAIAVFCAGTLVATCSAASAASSAGAPAPVYTYARQYVNGQVTHYAYAEDQTQTGQPGTELTAVARLRSYVRDRIGGEQVKWVALNSDGQDLSAQARAFPQYDLSLDPQDPNGLALPDTQTAGQLQAPIDDLLNFYVDLSVDVGIGNLHQPGQSFVDPTLLSGNFSNATTPVGQDLTQLTTTLTSLSAGQATFTSSFQPPPGGGLTLSQPFMSSPVCGTSPNNFELVQAAGTEYVALWGCESFTVTTVVDRPSGQIVSAQMTNPLQLDGTLCQDEALTECTPIPSTTLQRTVQLIRE
jgi:hypothetical protein